MGLNDIYDFHLKHISVTVMKIFNRTEGENLSICVMSAPRLPLQQHVLVQNIEVSTTEVRRRGSVKIELRLSADYIAHSVL
jgi:hypothetical protein